VIAIPISGTAPGQKGGIMTAVKIVAIVCVVYIGIVVSFESLLGHFQPTGRGTMSITTTEDGGTHTRVVSRLETDGKLYVAANHWPRAWYREALKDPDVAVTFNGETGDYRAVPVNGAEYDHVNAEHPLGLVTRFLTGFPPRRIMRLDPR
jgi:hypothetical protein